MANRTIEPRLRKPKRDPPAPPLPPKPNTPNYWLATPNTSSDYQTASEYNICNHPPSESQYSERIPHSVKSLPHTTHYVWTPHSTGQDYPSYASAQSECACCPSVCSEVQSRRSNTCFRPTYVVPHAYSTCSMDLMHSMSISNHMPSTPSRCTVATTNRAERALPSLPANVTSSYPSLQPVPQERKNRPKLSISPMPVVKIKNTMTGRYKCEAFTYKRHIEQHIERLFKYLSDRRKRLEDCEAAIERAKERNRRSEYRQLLVHKETRYLRSLRSRLRIEDFEEIKELGSGFIGKVDLVEERRTKNLYAMKKLKKFQVFKQNHMAHVMAERDILAEADNEWIVKLYHSFQDDTNLYFILEYTPGGDMMSLLINRKVFPRNWARFYIAEISLAVQYVHDMGFIHRDLKPDNILIDASGHIKLTDFGLCTGFRWTHDSKYYKQRDDTEISYPQRNIPNGNGIRDVYPTITTNLTRREVEYSKKKLSVVGSFDYIAPEVLKGAPDGTIQRFCDWWSVGVILYEMVIGYCPFRNMDLIRSNVEYSHELDPPEEIQKRIVNWKRYLNFPKSEHLVPDLEGKTHAIDDATKDLITGWICDPEYRRCKNGIEDIKKHSFFTSEADWDWASIRSKPAPFQPDLEDPTDTKYFPPNGQMNLGYRPPDDGPIMPLINDFTYHAFWQNSKNF